MFGKVLVCLSLMKWWRKMMWWELGPENRFVFCKDSREAVGIRVYVVEVGEELGHSLVACLV